MRNVPGTARERSHDDPPLLFDERQDVIGALQLPWLGLSRPSWPRDPDLIVNRCDGVIIWLIIGPRDGGNFDCHGEGAVVAELERGEPNPDYPSGIKEHLAGWAGLAWQLGDERKSRGGGRHRHAHAPCTRTNAVLILHDGDLWERWHPVTETSVIVGILRKISSMRPPRPPGARFNHLQS